VLHRKNKRQIPKNKEELNLIITARDGIDAIYYSRFFFPKLFLFLTTYFQINFIGIEK